MAVIEACKAGPWAGFQGPADTHYPGPWTLDPEPWTLNPEPL